VAQLKPVVSECIFWVSFDLRPRSVAMLCTGLSGLASQSKMIFDFGL
jgi:hypothetical protein